MDVTMTFSQSQNPASTKCSRSSTRTPFYTYKVDNGCTCQPQTVWLFTVVIFELFFGSFSISFYSHFSKVDIRMRQELTKKWSFSHSFLYSIFIVLSNSAPTPDHLQQPSLLKTIPSPSHLNLHHNSITSHHHHSHSHAWKSHKWLHTIHFGWNMSPKNSNPSFGL